MLLGMWFPILSQSRQRRQTLGTSGSHLLFCRRANVNLTEISATNRPFCGALFCPVWVSRPAGTKRSTARAVWVTRRLIILRIKQRNESGHYLKARWQPRDGLACG